MAHFKYSIQKHDKAGSKSDVCLTVIMSSLTHLRFSWWRLCWLTGCQWIMTLTEQLILVLSQYKVSRFYLPAFKEDQLFSFSCAYKMRGVRDRGVHITQHIFQLKESSLLIDFTLSGTPEIILCNKVFPHSAVPLFLSR